MRACAPLLPGSRNRWRKHSRHLISTRCREVRQSLPNWSGAMFTKWRSRT